MKDKVRINNVHAGDIIYQQMINGDFEKYQVLFINITERITNGELEVRGEILGQRVYEDSSNTKQKLNNFYSINNEFPFLFKDSIQDQ
jgi:hypothetical protein